MVALLLKRLKITLLYKKAITILLILSCTYTFYIVSKEDFNSQYSGIEEEISGYINDVKVDGNKVNFTVLGKEKVVAVYYLKTINDKQKFLMNYKNGQLVKVTGSLKKPSDNRVFNLFNYKKYLLGKKIYWLMDVIEIKIINENIRTQYKIKNTIIARIDKIEKGSTYLKAFILGNTADITSDIMTSYQINGTNHLLAISGMHITLLSGFILKIIGCFCKYKKANYFITISFLFCYLFIIDFQPSAVRATLLFALLTINKIFNFKLSTIHYLIFILSILLIYNPFYIYNLGFIFSFVISFYLVMFQIIIRQYNSYILKLFMVSLIAFLASIPILINNFFQINLLSPIINLFFVPYVSIIVFPLSLLTFIFPFLSDILIISIDILENLSFWISKIDIFIIILGKVHLIIIIVYYIIITISLWLITYKHFYGLLFILLMLFLHTNYRVIEKYPKLTVIDVGQGDSILIELPHDKGNILIDTGGVNKYYEKWSKPKEEYSLGKQTIIPYLKSLGIKKINYLIITHGDSDHIKEATSIINNFPIDNMIFNSGNVNENEQKVIQLLKGKKINYHYFNKNTLKIDKYQFSFLNGENKQDENEDSLIVYTKLNGKNILLMGDAGIASERKIITEYKLPKMDILKVGHHGSQYSSSIEFLNVIKPDLALISVGLNNRFNHPHHTTIDKLKEKGITYYMTSINGSIRLILKEKIAIYTCIRGTLMH